MIGAGSCAGGGASFVGCIPSKALLHVVHVLEEAKELEHRGISFGKPKIDLAKLRAWVVSKTINKLTFFNCVNLKNVTIPNSVSSIKQGAFNNCKNLTNIIIPKSVQSIGYEAFYGTSLKSIQITTDTKLAKKAFPESTIIIREDDNYKW